MAVRKNIEGVIELLEHGAIPTGSAIKRLKKWKKLNLSHRDLKKVPRWVKLFTGLERLDLSHNTLTYLPTYLGHFTNLKKLNLEGNPLESIPAEIRRGKLSGLLSYLRELDKSKGEAWRRVKLLFVGKENVGKTSLLQALQAFMAHSSPSAQFNSTSLAATPHSSSSLSSAPSSVFLSGQLNYISDSKLGIKKERTTTQSSSFMRTLSTDGIALGELSTENYSKRKEVYIAAKKSAMRIKDRPHVIFQTYDFGGQEVFYPTHQFFLTARSIYLVIFKATDGDQAIGSIKYWVNQIRTSTKGLETPILLVGTHIDHPNVDVDSLQHLAKRLRRQDSNIRDVLFVSSATGVGLPELVDKLITIAERHSFLRAIIPTSYHRFYNTILNLRGGRQLTPGSLRSLPSTFNFKEDAKGKKKDDLWSSEGSIAAGEALNFITWSHLEQIATNCGVTSSEDIHLMVSFFHDVGLLIHFEEAFGGLRDLVIINPQWLALVMKSVVSFSNKWIRNGILYERQLHWVWLDFPRRIHPLLLRILERFQIAFRIRTARRLSASEEERRIVEKRTGAEIIIPSLLPEEVPTDMLDREWTSFYTQSDREMVEFGRRYLLSFIPIGLFARLMVRILHIPRTRLVVAWRTGFIIEFITSVHSMADNTEHPCLVRALFQQITEQQNEFCFYLRGFKDELGPATSSTVKHSEKSVVALLEQLIYAMDTLFSAYSGLETRKLIPYSVPSEDKEADPRRNERSLLNFIPYSKAVKAVMKGRSEVNCDGHRLPLSAIAPDVAMASVRVVLPEEISTASRIGAGGFGQVLKGFWHGQMVAIKQLHEMTGLEEAEVETHRIKQFDEFKQEAFLMSCFDNPNVVCLHGVQMNPLAMVMEFAPKGDLHRLLNSRQKATVKCNHPSHPIPEGFNRRRVSRERMTPMLSLRTGAQVVVHSEDLETGIAQVESTFCEKGSYPLACLKKADAPLPDDKIPWTLRWNIALDIAKGLLYLHSFQPPIVHRDLRSPNIFLFSLDPKAAVRAKIGDFGLARHVNPKLYEMLRTWQWLPPEILDLERLEYDERADIYSFAIVLWELASRQTPFLDEYWDRFQRNGYFQEKDCIKAIIEENLRPTIPQDCPKDFADLMRDCWHPDPQQRPTLKAIVRRLEETLGNRY